MMENQQLCLEVNFHPNKGVVNVSIFIISSRIPDRR